MAGVVESDSSSGCSNVLSLDSIRESLIRQEDTIVFSLIERAKFPLNAPAFEESRCLDSGNSSSLTEFFVREIETIQAKVHFPFKKADPFLLQIRYRDIKCIVLLEHCYRLFHEISRK